MQSRGPAWWLLYAFGAVVAFLLAGRLVAMVFASFFSLLIVEENIDLAGVRPANGQAQAGFVEIESSAAATTPAPPSIPGAARPLTEADLRRPAPHYLETPSNRCEQGR